MYVAFPRSEYYGHADSLQMHRRFSAVVSTPLLPLSFPSSAGSPMCTNVDSNEMREVAVTSPSLPLPAAPDRAWGNPGASMLPSGLSGECRPSGLETSKGWSLPVKIGSGRGKVPRRMKPASFGLTMSSLSQAPHLEDLSSAPCAFQGHAAHPVQRRTELSPNGSPATWYHRWS
jgi:hypothetical protein